ncbi:L,D-transpeptidase [Roseisalinus antarcticus]|uniref:Putative L,D-transpeptidase ErfK/SrfK n=1 Tax=Roseisalinus antarcticus TaxID=254357 RepID=A0A1Y5SKV4_9RHOB|nr:L,D-transpeptidase [Roseisalinus antarcticus]SLN43179.1 putative L,D-transpeptidase ErfK/SrfK precursor [Roseisalinus antarcticus]
MINRRNFLASAGASLLAAPALANAPTQIPADMRRELVELNTNLTPGDIHLYKNSHNLYFIMPNRQAMAYKIGVGELGRQWDGATTIQRKVEWPSWTPTANMVRRDPDKYRQFAGGVPGGPNNPLGSRALYLYRGGRDTLYRIHGTPQPWTVGLSSSNGCIRMFNEDVIDLYERVQIGATVVAH